MTGEVKTNEALAFGNPASGEEPVWTAPSAALLQYLQSDGEQGLSREEADKRLASFGANILHQEKGVSALERMLSQFKSPVVLVLIAALVLSALLGEVIDAPALKEASIGVAMGKGGTEVARQASSLILADDNFSTIVSAVEEGRAVHGNIRRTTRYLLAGNMAEILVMLIAAIMAWPMPLFAIHLLWINLITDGVPTLALAAERVPKNLLRESCRPSPATFAEPGFFANIFFTGTLTAALTLLVYGFSLKVGDETYARTNAFSVLVFAELFRSFADRSDRDTVFELGVFTNPYHVARLLFLSVFSYFCTIPQFLPMSLRSNLCHYPNVYLELQLL